ncbi:MAG: hypothetical protein ACREEE_14000 [Dongiaceae bacterium]
MAKLGALVVMLAAILSANGLAHREAEAQTIGWGCLPSYTDCGGGQVGNSTVGLPFEWRLTAWCPTAVNEWSVAAVEIQAGRLPPGLELQPSFPFRIVGVPTRAGSFSFQVMLRGIYCPGAINTDFASNYTITVTGN